jgi:hypothetical protein
MKNLGKLLVIFFLMMHVSCQDESELLIGEWSQTEEFYSTGGPPIYKPATGNSMTFRANGTFSSTSPSCSGTYSDGTLTFDNCWKRVRASYKVKGTTLTLNFTCVEPCGEKFTKVN